VRWAGQLSGTALAIPLAVMVITVIQFCDDDAERAVRSGLSLVDAVGRLDVKSVKFHARVGIATGWWSSAI
jgi:hypothetical protein